VPLPTAGRPNTTPAATAVRTAPQPTPLPTLRIPAAPAPVNRTPTAPARTPTPVR
jgi:hypothetical protein